MLEKIEGIPQESLLVNFEVKHIYLCIKEMSLLYLRYTDGIFMIRKDTKTELMTFIKELNENHNTIKFDFEISPRKIAFLDAMLSKVKNSNIQTTLYRKHIDQQAFLQAKSEHPSLNININIPYGEVLSLKSTCSTTIEFYKNCAIIKQKFLG